MSSIPRLLAVTTRTSRIVQRPFIASRVSVWRVLHTSTPAYAKKKKQQTVNDEDLFASDSDEDDLFSGLSKSAETSTAGPQDTISLVEHSPNKLYEDKALQLMEQKRAEEFSNLHSWFIQSTGARGKETRLKPSSKGLRRLVSLAKTQAEIQQIITILRQWRAYPARTHKVLLEVALLQKAIETSTVPLIIPVLMHHPLYGISVPSLQLARRLMKEIVSPVNSYPPPYSPSNHVENDLTTGFVSEDQVAQALQLAEVLSATILPASEPQNRTFSPSTDLVSGAMILSLLLRVPKSGMVDDASPQITALVDLAQKMKKGCKLDTINRPQDARERLWTLAALRECQAALASQDIVAILSRCKSGGMVKMDAEKLTTWIASEILDLEQCLGTMGLAIVKKARVRPSPPQVAQAPQEQSIST